MAVTLLTANQMVQQALLMIGEFTPSEVPQQKYISEGLMWLNLRLRTLSASGITIPFQQLISFNLSPSQANYTVGLIPPVDVVAPYMTDISAANVELNGQAYPLRPIGVVQFGNSYVNLTSTGLPSYLMLNNIQQSSELTFYPIPDQTYLCNIYAKCVITPITLNAPLMNVPDYWQEFIIYDLASRLANVFPTAVWTEKLQKELDDLTALIVNTNEVDLTLSPSNIVSGPYSGFYWPIQGGLI